MAALLDLRMPGVYTQEIPTLPPTVGVIQSAVPVFIGYTEKAEKKGEDLSGKPTRIKSMNEYELWFGGPQKVTIEVDIDERDSNPNKPEGIITKVGDLKHKMHYALMLYFANGGGPCFIQSVGKYSDGDPDPAKYGANIFKALQKAKDVTILVFPDGPSMDVNGYKGIIEAALKHCEKMKNRVCIIDVHGGDQPDADISGDAETFQTNMPSDIDFKKYGMAYYPFLKVGLSYAYAPSEVTIRHHLKDSDTASRDATDELLSSFRALESAKTFKSFLEEIKANVSQYRADNPGPPPPANTQIWAYLKLSKSEENVLPQAVQDAFKDDTKDLDKVINDAITTADTDVTKKDGDYKTAITNANTAGLMAGKILTDLNDLLINKIRDAIRRYGVVMPPSAAAAGIYVRTDATQGVWKAPANMGVFGTIAPVVELDDDDHANLNAPDNGKAINVIRTYPGRGILVYGGRTLAGNDLEWRYVNVRRTFCFIEDSVARAMQDFVFAPNTQETWIKVKSMIDSFLNRLWKAGGLYGATPEDAYQVIVGEPDSMSIDDVLNGIMRVIIKVAVARPAEFIILQYEHKFELTEA